VLRLAPLLPPTPALRERETGARGAERLSHDLRRSNREAAEYSFLSGPFPWNRVGDRRRRHFEDEEDAGIRRGGRLASRSMRGDA
jgi:hypothetical protein